MTMAIKRVMFEAIHKDYFALILKEKLNKTFKNDFKVIKVIIKEDKFIIRVTFLRDVDVRRRLVSFFGVEPKRFHSVNSVVEYTIYWNDIL